VAVVLTLVQTKQIRINIHKRNNTKNTVQKILSTEWWNFKYHKRHFFIYLADNRRLKKTIRSGMLV